MPQSPLQKRLIGDLTWKRLGRSLLFIYTCFALYVYFRADSMIFLPQPPSYSDTQEILKILVTPTESISALYLPNPQAKYTLLYIHGNAEDLGSLRTKHSFAGLILESTFTSAFRVIVPFPILRFEKIPNLTEALDYPASIAPRALRESIVAGVRPLTPVTFRPA